MNSHVWSLIKVARQVARDNPLLGYQLEQEARRHEAVINPGAKSFDKDLESMVTVLKSLKQELEGAMKKMSEDPDAAEFAKFFDDEASAEEEELRQLLKKTASHVAGPKDWFKKMFKKKDKGEKSEKAPKDEEPEGIKPSYQMDDSTIDEFVEGKREWADPGHYIEQERGEHGEFFNGAKDVLKQMDDVRKKPSKNAIQGILKTIEKLIRHGENMMKGMRKHLMEPAAKVEVTEEGMEKKGPKEKGKLKPEELSMTVTNYGQSLMDAAGDEKKTISLLKELFDAVGPMIKENRAELASVQGKLLPILVKVAHSTPRTRPVLLPAIRRMSALAAPRRANKPVFKLELRDKGQSGNDHAQIDFDKGWTWRRVDPSGHNVGYSRTFLTPEELVRDIQNYAKPTPEAAKAAAYFDQLAKAEGEASVATIARRLARR